MKRVYADFNDLPRSTDDDRRMWLAYYGSIRDLARQRIRLREGMRLTLYDSSDGDEDMEVEAVVRFDASATDLRLNWYIEVELSTFRRVPHSPDESFSMSMPCTHCGVDLEGTPTHLDASTLCPRCGGLVLDFLRRSADGEA